MKKPKDFVIEFAEFYTKETGNTYYPTWGRDCKIFKVILGLKDINPEILSKMIRMFFKMPYRVRTIPYFYSCLTEVFPMTLIEEVKGSKRLNNPEKHRYD